MIGVHKWGYGDGDKGIAFWGWADVLVGLDGFIPMTLREDFFPKVMTDGRGVKAAGGDFIQSISKGDFLPGTQRGEVPPRISRPEVGARITSDATQVGVGISKAGSKVIGKHAGSRIDRNGRDARSVKTTENQKVTKR